MRLSIFILLVLGVLGLEALDVPQQNTDTRLLPVHRPEHTINGQESAKDLLSTLQELHHSLIMQIALLENMQKSSLDENENTAHLVLHYTAQKNNIEREISLIKSIEASPKADTAPRHILKTILPEEKIVPSLLNIFKKPKNPIAEQSNYDIGYSIPYPPYYVSGYDSPHAYPYNGAPSEPDHHYPNDLIQDTFSGYQPPPQTFAKRQQFLQNHQTPRGDQPNLQVPQQYTPPPQVTLQPHVQPPQPPRTEVQPQIQVEASYSPQPQAEQKPQTNQQQPQYGQKQGVFVYYPNGIEEPERQSIADRVGQAFDRFGEVISNLAHRQPSTNSMYENNGNFISKSPARNRVRNSRPRSSNGQKVKDPQIEEVMPRKLDDDNSMKHESKKPKARWVSA